MRPALRAIVLAPWTPAWWFRAGEPGDYWHFQDLQGLYQDSAGTTPVTAVGDPVGRWVGRLGRIVRIQSTAINRPTLQIDSAGRYYLSYNGSNQWMQTSAAVNFTSTDKMTVVAGVYKGADAATSTVFESGAGGGNGSFAIFAPLGAAANFSFRTTTAGGVDARDATTFAAPIKAVLSCSIDNAQDGAANSIRPRVNGSIPTLATSSDLSTSGNFGNLTIYFGARSGSSLFLNGGEYSLILRGVASSPTGILHAERWANKLTGAF